MSIICATHFSEQASMAATSAAQLGRRWGVRLWLVHVPSAAAERALGGAGLRPLEDALRAEVERLAALGGSVDGRLLSGELSEAVLAFAVQQDAKLIVVGPPGRESPFGGLGGHLDRLARATPVPLLVVKQAEPLIAWAARERPLKVMLGVDRSEPAAAARRWLAELERHGPVEVMAAHVLFVPEECRRLGLPVPAAFDELSPELEDRLREEMAPGLGQLDDGRPIPLRLQPGIGRKADRLIELARKEAVDLLLVGTRPRHELGKLWSVSHHALRLAPMSVACVPIARPERGAETLGPAVKDVLVPTDFSEQGDAAVRLAFSIVAPGGTVHLLHVGEPKLSPEQERSTVRRLADLIPAAAQRTGRQARVEVRGGADVALLILRAAERLDVDLVCLSAHGKNGGGGAPLGSVARRVVTESRRSVLIARPGPDPHGALRRGTVSVG